MQNKERAMFGKSKDDNDQLPSPVQQPERPAVAKSAEQGSTDQVSTISRGMTIVGKISGEGTLNLFGHVEGDVVAQELTIAGQVKGAIHATRVKLNSTALVEGDIFHRSLSIEENARFEGSSKREDNAVDMAPHQASG